MYFLDAMYNPDGDEITEMGMLSDFEPVEVSDKKPSAPDTLSVDISAIRPSVNDPGDQTPRNADTSGMSYLPKTNKRVYSNPIAKGADGRSEKVLRFCIKHVIFTLVVSRKLYCDVIKNVGAPASFIGTTIARAKTDQ
jgi:hypothetical protein